jgi:hypothetical protein
MPYGAIIPRVADWLTDIRQDELAEQRAAGEGMFERYVTLEGVRIPRMLSWAELRALHQDLREAQI